MSGLNYRDNTIKDMDRASDAQDSEVDEFYSVDRRDIEKDPAGEKFEELVWRFAA